MSSSFLFTSLNLIMLVNKMILIFIFLNYLHFAILILSLYPTFFVLLILSYSKLEDLDQVSKPNPVHSYIT